MLATECYSRALLVAPDSYDAKLGLGITYLARARGMDERADTREPMLTAAKRALGEAYMVRQGPFEPLYYLAEVAVLEKDYDSANKFLKVLHESRAKFAPVAAMMGYIAEKQGDSERAKELYREAVQAGQPYETVLFASAKLKGGR